MLHSNNKCSIATLSPRSFLLLAPQNQLPWKQNKVMSHKLGIRQKQLEGGQ